MTDNLFPNYRNEILKYESCGHKLDLMEIMTEVVR